jgi:hypothetical protein
MARFQPRVLRTAESAEYLGMSEEYFAKHVAGAVKPLDFPGTRAKCYDIRDLDAWLDNLKCPAKSPVSTWMPVPADGSSTASIAADASLSELLSARQSARKPKRAYTSFSPRKKPSAAR